MRKLKNQDSIVTNNKSVLKLSKITVFGKRMPSEHLNKIVALRQK